MNVRGQIATTTLSYLATSSSSTATFKVSAPARWRANILNDPSLTSKSCQNVCLPGVSDPPFSSQSPKMEKTIYAEDMHKPFKIRLLVKPIENSGTKWNLY